MSNLHNNMHNGLATNYHIKYLLYKKKYLNLLKLRGGNPNPGEWDDEGYVLPPLRVAPLQPPAKPPVRPPTHTKEKFKTISKQHLVYYSKDKFLFNAIIKNNFELVRKIIEDDWTDEERVKWHEEIEESNKWEYNPSNPKTKVMDPELLEYESSVDYKPTKKITNALPLTVAFKSIIDKDSRIIKLLIEKGIYDKSENPLFFSSKLGLLDIVQLLISQDMISDSLEIIYDGLSESKTSLDIALENNNIDIAKLLINSDTDIKTGESFNIALSKKFADVIELLLIKDITLLKYADPVQIINIIKLNEISLIKILIESGNKHLLSNINILFDNINDRTLISLKKYIDDISEHFNIGLLHASKKIPDDVLKITAEMLGNPNYEKILTQISTKIKDLALIISVINNSTEETRNIINKGYNINQKFNNLSALDFAFLNNNLEIVKLLINSEINLTFPQYLKIVKLNDFNLIKLLIEKGYQILLDNIDEILKNDDIKEKLRDYVRNPQLQNNQDQITESLRSK